MSRLSVCLSKKTKHTKRLLRFFFPDRLSRFLFLLFRHIDARFIGQQLQLAIVSKLLILARRQIIVVIATTRFDCMSSG